MSGQTSLEQLARLRTIGARNSEQVYELADQLLKNGHLGDQEWAVREQFAIAALDLNKIERAEYQLGVLFKKFRNSPRIAALRGLELEAKGQYEEAERLYMSLLGTPIDIKGKAKAVAAGERLWVGQTDETFITAHQRLITLSLYHDSSDPELSTPTPNPKTIARTIPLLVTYLDTFYTDPDAWSLLADLYLLLSGWNWLDEAWSNGSILAKYFPSAKVGGQAASPTSTIKVGDDKYLQQAMTCLGQRMTLESWNWMTLARYGELALMWGDVTLAYKTFLRAIEMATDPLDAKAELKPKVSVTDGGAGLLELQNTSGWNSRVWWDLKLCTTHLLSSSSSGDRSTISPTPASQVDAIDALVNEKLGAKAVDVWNKTVA